MLDRCKLNGQEVSEAEFDAWYEANMTNDVTWYSPDGTVIPENMRRCMNICENSGVSGSLCAFFLDKTGKST